MKEVSAYQNFSCHLFRNAFHRLSHGIQLFSIMTSTVLSSVGPDLGQMVRQPACCHGTMGNMAIRERQEQYHDISVCHFGLFILATSTLNSSGTFNTRL
jgi:hypothetical protein